MDHVQTISRRGVVATGAAVALAASLPARHALAGAPPGRRLTAAAEHVPLAGAPYPETGVWAYDGAVPGPELRFRQGERLWVALDNGLPEDTTVHWHGVRVPNAMDGVPELTQAPIAPGARFVYAFDLPDAGAYWYHPHQRSFEQVARGLYGALVVEEPHPPPVDRDVVWMLGDWRLLPDASIAGDFGNRMETGMAGRIGNTVTVNGRVTDTFAVRAGERLRLRLVNAATARIFALEFREHRPTVIALDGQPVVPHAPESGRIVLGPAQRADLVLDLTGVPGARSAVVDSFYQGLEYRLLDLAYGPERLRDRPPGELLALPPNTMPEPDLATAERHEITLGGGMMSGMMGAGAAAGGMDGMAGMMRGMTRGGGMGMAWTVNGVAATGHDMAPMLELARDRSYILVLSNETAWWHPIHLHGHAFRVLARNGTPTPYREWRDTVLLRPQERVEIAFVADNPGQWMIHCHVLDHQNGGMMAVIAVT